MPLLSKVEAFKTEVSSVKAELQSELGSLKAKIEAVGPDLSAKFHEIPTKTKASWRSCSPSWRLSVRRSMLARPPC